MKRKMLVVTMVISMMMAGLMAACGNNGDVPANNTIIDTPTPTSEPESPDPTIAPDDEGVVDSGVLDEIPNGNEENEKFTLGSYSNQGTRLDYSMLFPDTVNAEAWLQEHRFENPDYSFYITHFKGAKGTMDFTWVAPAGIGNLYWLSENEKTFHVANDSRRLAMWHGGKLVDENDFLKNYSANENMELVAGNPIEGTYQVVEDSESAYRVIFKVESQIFDATYVGIACFIDFYDIGECYQFTYYMLDFDETEALAVVNSIERVNLEDLGIIIVEE